MSHARATRSPLLSQLRDAIREEELIEWSDSDGEKEFDLFLKMFDVVDLRDASTARMNDGSIYASGLADMVRLHARRRSSHVLFTGLSENWGAFSTPVPGRTVDWGDWQANLVAGGCTAELVRQYLDDPAVKAVVTTQHTAFCHPTILTLPIGIRGVRDLLAHLLQTDGAKTQDLLVNNSGWGHRQQINLRVIANFGGRLRNGYGLSQSEYYGSVARSRFVLCPSGLGWDSYRVWEALALGSIPVVEYSAGWHAVLDNLPALFVTSFDEVTPALLASAYPDILSRADRFDYGKLTRRWWARRITALLDAR